MAGIPYQPLSFGRLLDRSFQLYRQHFVKLLLLTLILFGPFYLLYSWIFADSISNSFSFWGSLGGESVSVKYGNEELNPNGGIGAMLFFFLVLLPLALFVITPVAFSTVTILVRSVYDREEPQILEALKTTFRRFWPLFGNAHLFFLMMLGIYIVFVIGLVLVIMLFAVILGIGAGLGGAMNLSPGPGFAFAIILFYLAFAFLVYVCIGFFLIRWGYFVPVVVLEKEGIGFGRSWRLTKGSFWRLLAVYVVVTLVMTVFNFGILLLISLIPVLVLQILLPALVYIVLFPMLLTVYGVSYWDLRIRAEGLDLEQMLSRVRGPADSTGENPV